MAGLHLEKLSLAPNILRLFIVVCSLIPFALVSSWSSNGVTYYDFNAKDFNHVHSFEFYIVVSVVTFVSGVITCIIVLLDLKIMPCIVDITVSIVLMVFWVVSDSLLVTSLSNLSETVAVKEARLDFSQIEGAINLLVLTTAGK
uniref:MARVEL domain-containing protein n=1 Tax=Octopus bimaculoides TaxID=37653 RepID=A0A0L8GYQ2_OCTBM